MMENSTEHKKKLVVVRGCSEAHEDVKEKLEEISKEFDVWIGPSDDWISKETLLQQIKDADAVVSFHKPAMSKDVIEQAPKLKVIANYGAGYDTVDVEYATKRGIWVTNTPDVLSDATSDVAIFLILACCRRTSEAEKWARDGHWLQNKNTEHHLGVDPYGKTLGILGMGSIGKRVAKKAQVFGMSVIYHNRNRIDPKEEEALSVKYVDMDTLLQTSDFLSINLPLNASTKHLIDKPQFAKMKKTSYIINTARGAIINEQALVDALKSGQIRGAGLDVFEEEPKIHPDLLTLPNVTILPHIGSATKETRGAMWKVAIDNAVSVLRGRPPLTPVNQPQLP